MLYRYCMDEAVTPVACQNWQIISVYIYNLQDHLFHVSSM